MDILPTVATVAADEPEIAAKMVVTRNEEALNRNARSLSCYNACNVHYCYFAAPGFARRCR